MTHINAITPIDGRYFDKVKKLADFFSEKALFRYRVLVEVEYFIALCELPLPQLKDFPRKHFESLRDIYRSFEDEDALRIKEIEKITNHDIKAVEYFIKEQMEMLQLGDYKEFAHFALTSQDINNTAVPLSIKEAYTQEYRPLLEGLIRRLRESSEEWKDIAMPAHTHGQPASPTRLGKEIRVFAVRLEEQLNLLDRVPFAAKFGGATGHYNAHKVAYPEVDWPVFARQFVEENLGLKHSYPTTQIEHYDHLAAFFDGMKRIHTILLDLDRDIWTYISMRFFRQKINPGEVGSSAMPHKVNPIDFENSEGNLGLANALLTHLSAKLPVSRLQRDLTDSTVLRNVGLPFAYGIIAMKSTLKGWDKIIPDQEVLEAALEDNWAVVAEALQTILRRESFPKPYEALKALTRTHKKMNRESIAEFIDGLDVPEAVKDEMRAITPHNYTGYA